MWLALLREGGEPGKGLPHRQGGWDRCPVGEKKAGNVCWGVGAQGMEDMLGRRMPPIF